MAEENQKLNLEDYLRDLEIVWKSDNVDKLKEYYNKHKNKSGSDLTEVYHNLGELVANDKDTFVQATDSGILGPTADWQNSKMPEVAGTIKKYQSQIFADYSAMISQLIAMGRKKLEEQETKKIEKENPELSPEIKKRIIEERVNKGIYGFIGNSIYDLPASDSYSEHNPEVYGLVQQIKELEQLRDENRTEELKKRMVAAKGLPSSFESLPVANKWAGNVDQQISVFKRTIGAQFVNKDDTLNTKELDAYTKDSLESYRRMGSEVYNYKKAAQQSKK